MNWLTNAMAVALGGTMLNNRAGMLPRTTLVVVVFLGVHQATKAMVRMALPRAGTAADTNSPVTILLLKDILNLALETSIPITIIIITTTTKATEIKYICCK